MGECFKTEDETHLQSVGDGSHNLVDHRAIPLKNNNDSPKPLLQMLALAPPYSSLNSAKTLRENTEIFSRMPFW
jgi:hypothetical protein